MIGSQLVKGNLIQEDFSLLDPCWASETLGFNIQNLFLHFVSGKSDRHHSTVIGSQSNSRRHVPF